MTDYVKISADDVVIFGRHKGGCQCGLCIRLNTFNTQLKAFGWSLEVK